jgi:hypothetical protein
MTRMTDVEYARKIAPEAFAEEDRIAAENAAVEARFAPKAAPAPAAPSWRPSGTPGVFVRDDPVRGVTDIVENVNGTVLSSFRPYKAPPVAQEASFAQTLISDMPDRFNKVLGHLAAGQIEEAEAERAEIKKFTLDNMEDLRAFSSYSGRDPVVRAAAARSMQLITGAWLPDEAAIRFNPKANPASARADLDKQGLPLEVLPYLEGARAGNPAAIEIMDALGEKHLVNAPATRETAARRQAAQAAADTVPGAQRPVDPAEFLALHRDVENALGELPEDMRSVPALSGASAVRVTRGLYAAGDIAAGAALRIGSRAVDGLEDLPPAARAEMFKDVANKTAAAVAAFPDAGQRELAAAAFEELAGSGRQVGSQLPAVRESVARAMARADAFSAGSGVPMPREAFVKLAKAERHIASGTGSEPDADIRPVVSALSRATALKSNTTAVYGEMYAAESHRGLMQSEAQAQVMAQKAGQPAPPVMSMGHELQRDAAAEAFDRAATAVAVNPSVSFTAALAAQAGPLAGVLLTQGAESSEVAMDAAKLALHYLDYKNGGNLPDIISELQRDSSLIRDMLKTTEPVPEGEAPKASDTYDVSPLVAENQLQQEVVGSEFEAVGTSPDLEMFNAGRKLEVGKLGVQLFGSGEFKQAKDLLGSVAEEATLGIFNAESPAVKDLSNLRADKLSDEAVLNGIAEKIVVAAKAPGRQRVFGVVGDEVVRAAAREFVGRTAARMRSKLEAAGTPASSYAALFGDVDDILTGDWVSGDTQPPKSTLGAVKSLAAGAAIFATTHSPVPLVRAAEPLITGAFRRADRSLGIAPLSQMPPVMQARANLAGAVVAGIFERAGVPVEDVFGLEGSKLPVVDKQVAGKLKQYLIHEFADPAKAPAKLAPQAAATAQDPDALAPAGASVQPKPAGGYSPPADMPAETLKRAVGALAQAGITASTPVRDRGKQVLFSNIVTEFGPKYGMAFAKTAQGALAEFVHANPKASLPALHNYVATFAKDYEKAEAKEKTKAAIALKLAIAKGEAEIKAMSEGGALARPTAGE